MILQAAPAGVPDIAWRMCTSPIEQAFLSGAVEAARAMSVALEVVVRLPAELPHGRVLIVPQFVIVGHKTDFLVASGDQGIVVECDGKRFHRREAVVAHDRALDRAMQRAGVRVYRFSGEELWKNPTGCAETVIADVVRWAEERRSSHG